ncbi:putative FACT complex subunit spt16 [Blattamonas nauphoetae]|uniref:FACT complex subunit n=1 Tax=Blattamonas nauphoetae TaxID=2049346 RepID=A0ABQ9YA37_9EUKA|nr:putative FACT complex subunit spt16 [Blattamonas nauphoetae]
MAQDSGPSFVIDINTFDRHATALFNHWNTHPEARDQTQFLTLVSNTKDSPNSLIVAIQIWLLGIEFPHTWIILSHDTLTFITTKKKKTILEQLNVLNNNPGTRPYKISLLDIELFKVKTKTVVEDRVDEICQSIFGSTISETNKLGMIEFNPPEDTFPGTVMAKLRSKYPENARVDLSPMLAQILRPKDDAEKETLKLAGSLSAFFLDNYAVPTLLNGFENSEKLQAKTLSDAIESEIRSFQQKGVVPSFLDDWKKVPQWPTLSKMDNDYIEESYHPMVLSRDEKMTVFESSPATRVDLGTIRFEIGVKYKGYCSSVGRTLMINPTSSQEQLYRLLHKLSQTLPQMLTLPEDTLMKSPELIAVEVREKLVELLIQNNIASSETDDAPTKLAKAGEWIEKHFEAEIGFATGLMLHDDFWSINTKKPNEQPLLPNTALICRLCFNDLYADEAKMERPYHFIISDTYLIDQDGKVDTLTSSAQSRFGKVRWQLNDELPEDEDDAEERLKPVVVQSIRWEDVRIPISYEKISEISGPTMETLKQDRDTPHITIDQARKTVFFPINKAPVPFHISTIKSVSIAEERNGAYLRVNFHYPTQTNFAAAVTAVQQGGGNVGKVPLPAPGTLKFPNAIFIQELNYRCENRKILNNMARNLKELIKVQREKEKTDRDIASLGSQEKLLLSTLTDRVPHLRGVQSRPSLKKNQTGTLEIHLNGLRFITPKKEEIHIIFKNVRQAFLQIAHNELIALMHFHLFQPIMIGKTKTRDVQFYSEVVESARHVDSRSGRGFEGDDQEEERRELEHKRRVNKDFIKFSQLMVKHTSTLSTDGSQQINFDTPYRHLGFMAAPNTDMLQIMPTQNALVELTGYPATVVMLEDIAMAYFERVDFSLKTCDMYILPKDFMGKDPHKFKSIDRRKIDQIQTWLTQVNIPYTEGARTVDWGNVMKMIRADPEDFAQNGGWGVLLEEGEEEEEVMEIEYDEKGRPKGNFDFDYDPDDEGKYDGDEEESGDEDLESAAASSEFSSDFDSDADESDIDSPMEEDEGKDWSDLEEEARRQDMERFGHH